MREVCDAFGSSDRPCNESIPDHIANPMPSPFLLPPSPLNAPPRLLQNHRYFSPDKVPRPSPKLCPLSPYPNLRAPFPNSAPFPLPSSPSPFSFPPALFTPPSPSPSPNYRLIPYTLCPLLPTLLTSPPTILPFFLRSYPSTVRFLPLPSYPPTLHPFPAPSPYQLFPA